MCWIMAPTLPAPLRKSLREARAQEERTAFLCHSSKDNDLARGLVRLLQDGGWRVYVDYEDTALPLMPDRETARRIIVAIAVAMRNKEVISEYKIQDRLKYVHSRTKLCHHTSPQSKIRAYLTVQ
jgi:hypothetical protein